LKNAVVSAKKLSIQYQPQHGGAARAPPVIFCLQRVDPVCFHASRPPDGATVAVESALPVHVSAPCPFPPPTERSKRRSLPKRCLISAASTARRSSSSTAAMP